MPVLEFEGIILRYVIVSAFQSSYPSQRCKHGGGLLIPHDYLYSGADPGFFV